MRISAFHSRRQTLVLGAALALAVGPSCKSDHSALAYHPHAGQGGMGGQGGQGGVGGDGRGGAITKAGMAGDAGVHPDKHVDEPGRSVFTVVHGIVDAGSTVWCFARVRNGVTELVGEPVPAGGIDYGQSLSFESLPHVASASDGVVPFVITGELARLDGLDCAESVALATALMAADSGASGAGAAASAAGGAGGEGGGAGASGEGGAAAGALADHGGNSGQAGTSGAPALRVGSLPGLAAGALAQGYSVLEVADGCFGARAFTDKRQALICGSDYSPASGSLTAEVVILARQTASGELALQALHAARGVDHMGVTSAPPASDMQASVGIVDNFGEGQLLPRDPRVDLPSFAWGVNSSGWSVDMTVDSSIAASEPWSAIRRRAGIKQLVDGRGYTVIALGPSPDVATRGFWNPIAFALVDNDPPVSE